MIPINNASKYHRTVAVYSATFLWYTHLCSVYTSRSFLQKQHQQCFSGERYSSVIINSYLFFSFWFLLFAFFYDNVSAIRCMWENIRQNLNQTNGNIKSAEITHCSATCRAAKKVWGKHQLKCVVKYIISRIQAVFGRSNLLRSWTQIAQ